MPLVFFSPSQEQHCVSPWALPQGSIPLAWRGNGKVCCYCFEDSCGFLLLNWVCAWALLCSLKTKGEEEKKVVKKCHGCFLCFSFLFFFYSFPWASACDCGLCVLGAVLCTMVQLTNVAYKTTMKCLFKRPISQFLGISRRCCGWQLPEYARTEAQMQTRTHKEYSRMHASTHIHTDTHTHTQRHIPIATRHENLIVWKTPD